MLGSDGTLLELAFCMGTFHELIEFGQARRNWFRVGARLTYISVGPGKVLERAGVCAWGSKKPCFAMLS